MTLLGFDIVNAGECYRCKAPIYLPMELYKSARHTPAISFYCPYGHQLHFAEGETEEQKLRRERDRLQQRIAQKDDEIADERNRRHLAERSTTAYKGQITKIKNRVGRGVCPCCKRTFAQLTRHMASKHPGYATDDVEFKAS